MLKFLLFTLTFCLTSLTLFAQHFNIKGRLADPTDTTAFIHASVTLHDRDTTVLMGAFTDNSGGFAFTKVVNGDYIVKVECMGYDVELHNLSVNNENHDCGIIVLNKSVVQGDEVTITARRTTIEIDRQIILVSKQQKEASQDGYDLLYNMSLPGLIFNFASRTFSSINSGSVQLRIDGVVQPISELSTIQPDDVQKIEYIDQPGIRYGSGVAVVINVRTKRNKAGVQGGITTQNRVTSAGGDNSAYVRFIKGKDIFTVSSRYNYLTNKGQFSNQEKYLQFPTTELSPNGADILLRKVGTPMDNKSDDVNAKLEYNRQFNDKLMFNTYFSYNRKQAPDNIAEFRTEQDSLVNGVYLPSRETYTERTTTDDYSHNMAMDMYMEYKMRERDALIVNLTATNIISDYTRGYFNSQSLLFPDNESLDNVYTVDGDRKSLIGEIIYERAVWDTHTLTAGARGQFASTDNIYRGSTGDVNSFMVNNDVYAYTELKGALGKNKKFSYMLGLGVAVEKIQNNDMSRTFTFFRPTANLGYKINDNLQLRYKLELSQRTPNIAELTNIVQPINEYEVRISDPNLKPYQSYANLLTFTYNYKSTSLIISNRFNYNDNVIMNNSIRTDIIDDKYFFVQSQGNQKHSIYWAVQPIIQQKLFKDRLTILVGSQLYQMIVNGNGYNTLIENIVFFGKISYNVKQWGASFDYISRSKGVAGETIFEIRTSPIQLQMYYNYKDLRLGIGVQNPFMKNEVLEQRDLNSAILQQYETKYLQSNNNMVYVTCSWNFNLTNKARTYNKRTNNSDNTTGVMK